MSLASSGLLFSLLPEINKSACVLVCPNSDYPNPQMSFVVIKDKEYENKGSDSAGLVLSVPPGRAVLITHL